MPPKRKRDIVNDQPLPSKRARDTTEKQDAAVCKLSAVASCAERQRQADSSAPWRLWGPYVSERQWGTVREDCSEDGNCWASMFYEDATWRAYQWGEDGLLGICDDQANLCVGLALWNRQDHILKERLFGLTGPQGNHGEDVKECYYYTDATPTYAYLQALYKYPQTAFPYTELLAEATCRGVQDAEYELLDTGVFQDNKYWDVVAEYAKASATDILCQYTLHNRSSEKAELIVLPTVWFRNTWSWEEADPEESKPHMSATGPTTVLCSCPALGDYEWTVDKSDGAPNPQLMFTENDTNLSRLTGDSGARSPPQYAKDAFHNYLVHGDEASVNPSRSGTKSAAKYAITVDAGCHATVRCRLSKKDGSPSAHRFGKAFDALFNKRRQEADEFYKQVIPRGLSGDEISVARQAYAGLCWSKQFFYYDVEKWRKGRKTGINKDWRHMLNKDVISMPDKWEFPWYATWDLAFHMLPYADVDVEFAKQQLLLLLSDRYMHPNGQLPAYEFNFSDVNPPVHAWACLHVYHSSGPHGQRDTAFLKQCFHKLSLNFNWWMNKKVVLDSDLFSGGFLGLDNISCVDRSYPPDGATIEQVDGSCWMAFAAACLLQMALELAVEDAVYEQAAISFLNHYRRISDAINDPNTGLWDGEDGFYYDRLMDSTGRKSVLRVRSLVGLSALLPTVVLDTESLQRLPLFSRELQGFLIAHKQASTSGEAESRVLLSVPSRDQVMRLLQCMLGDGEFLSPFGIRSLSKFHKDKPFSVKLGGSVHTIGYCAGESTSDMFGGNSNWRGPVWLCMNTLLIEALDKYDEFYGDGLTVEFPSGSGHRLRLREVATRLRQRLCSLFLKDNTGNRPCHGGHPQYQQDHWRHLVLFYEYFDADTGRGCGASHQTGWTALAATLLKQLADKTSERLDHAGHSSAQAVS